MNVTKSVVVLIAACGLLRAETKWVQIDKKESVIHYHLTHPLHEVNAESKQVVSKIGVISEKKEIESVSASVDVTSFDSGNSNRDSHAMEVIDALDFPEASFSSTSVSEKGDSIFVTGKMTFHGITKEIIIKGVMKWLASSVEIDADFSLSLTEFKVDRPSLLMIPVEDELQFSLHAIYPLS